MLRDVAEAHLFYLEQVRLQSLGLDVTPKVCVFCWGLDDECQCKANGVRASRVSLDIAIEILKAKLECGLV